MRKHIVVSSLFAITLASCGSSSTSTSETSMLVDEEETMNATASTIVAPTDAVIDADGSVNINVNVGIDDYDTLAG